MTETSIRTHQQSIIIEATPETLYDLVSDITRTGEWSPIRTACMTRRAFDVGLRHVRASGPVGLSPIT